MNQTSRHEAKKHGRVRQPKLGYDDTRGIDADIEHVVAMLQRAHGYPREHACNELVRRLSTGARV